MCLVRACDRVIVYANPKFEQLFGYAPGELNGKPVSLINYGDAHIQPETQTNQIVERILEVGEWTYQVHNVKKDGTPFWCEATASTFEHPEYGRVLVAVQQDITARKEAEEQLQSLSNRLSLALESGAIGTWEWDILKDVHYWDDRMCALYGIQECTLQEQAWFESLHPDDRAATEAALQAALAGKTEFSTEFRIYRRDGRIRFLKAAALVQRNAQGRPDRMVGITYDITDLKQTQESLQTSLKEKDVLLQEIHHRVKNNLQIVYSLLRLQRRKLSDPQASICLLESQNRIESIGLIHEKLYRSGNLAKINFAEYIPSLVTNLFSSYDVSSDQIGLTTEIEAISLDIDRAIPCGLIINELVSNSLKYAFPGKSSGKIYVKLYTKSEPGQIVLVVGDDGVGISSGIDFNQLKTLGLQLVHDLAAQLKGTIHAAVTAGTEFQIMFPRGAC
ncbi:MAG TPA: PAS domain-containing protein [Leptolyngbyaceae cyanobacterium M33_DOE_097]|uniref:histidine kinase n=1 Tax=Oscillatoriales cyanobacterium SpSt-418 TaxID=2282169 RepID=A0A7C3KGU2_9CYAN|nr:PAS domain-containing protein [Leptolyngbyaceae cyanobacterium M33_DOE_097]